MRERLAMSACSTGSNGSSGRLSAIVATRGESGAHPKSTTLLWVPHAHCAMRHGISAHAAAGLRPPHPAIAARITAAWTPPGASSYRRGGGGRELLRVADSENMAMVGLEGEGNSVPDLENVTVSVMALIDSQCV